MKPARGVRIYGSKSIADIKNNPVEKRSRLRQYIAYAWREIQDPERADDREAFSTLWEESLAELGTRPVTTQLAFSFYDPPQDAPSAVYGPASSSNVVIPSDDDRLAP